jgi:PKD repeat protein
MQIFTTALFRKNNSFTGKFKSCFYGLFVAALFSITHSGYSQVIQYNFTPPLHAIAMCDTAGETVTLKVNNTGATAITDTFEIRLNYTGSAGTNNGLVIKNPAGADFTGTIENSSVLKVKISIGGSQEKQITFKIYASCDVAIGSNAQISGSADIVDSQGNPVTSSGNSFFVDANINGDLQPEPFVTVSPAAGIFDNAAPANIGDTVIREYSFLCSIKQFKGYIKFENTLPAGSPLYFDTLTGLRLIIKNSSGVVISNTSIINSHSYFVSLSPGQRAVIRETITVRNYLGQEDHYSNNHISSGCLPGVYCYHQDPSPRVKSDGRKVQFNVTYKEANLEQCLGKPAFHSRKVKFKNNGQVTAQNFWLQFEGDFLTISPDSSFRIIVRDKDSNVVKTGRVWSDPAKFSPLAGQEYHTYISCPYDTSCLRNALLPTSLIPNYSTDYSGCSADTINARFLFDKFINDSTGFLEYFNVEKNGGSIEVNWQERNCCFNINNFKGKAINTTYLKIIGNDGQSNSFAEMVNSFVFRTDNWTMSQNILPYNALMNGNPDKCTRTRDGEIQQFTIQDSKFQGDQLGEYLGDSTKWGNFTIDLDLDNGVDLDLSLEGTAVDSSYNPSLCADTLCSTCSPALWSATDTSRYSAYMEDPYISGAAFRWIPQSIDTIPLASGNYKSYRLTFNLKKYFEQVQGQFTSDGRSDIDHLLEIMSRIQLKFKLRAFCKTCSGSCESDPTYIHEKMYYTSGCSQCSPAIALVKKDFYLNITCPGCLTSGANVTSGVFERDSVSLGLKDEAPQDGAPDNAAVKISDPGLKANATNGDYMTSLVTTVLSDGDKTSANGFELSNLSAKGIYLDNLYVQYKIQNLNMLEYIGSSAEAMLEGQGTWVSIPDPFIDSTKYFTFHVTALNFGLGNFHSQVGKKIQIRSKFKINKDCNQVEDGRKRQLVHISYNGRFSDCDNCLDFNFPNNDARGHVACVKDSACTAGISNMYYICQAGESVFSYTPSEVILHNLGVNEGHCTFNHSYDFSYYFFDESAGVLVNPFFREYRSFLNNEAIGLTYTIPSGFKVTGIDIYNTGNNNRFYYLPNGGYDNYSVISINSQSEIDKLITARPSFDVMQMKLNLKNLPAAQSPRQGIIKTYAQGQTVFINKALIDTIRQLDDYAAFGINIELTAENCAAIPETMIYYEGTDVFPGVKIVPYARLDVPGFLSIDKDTARVLPATVNGVPGFMWKPRTRLIGTSDKGPELQFTSHQLYLPIRMRNTYPLDSLGNQLHGTIFPVLRGSVDAKFPYMFVKNYTDSLLNKGIKITGVYPGKLPDGANTASLPNYWQGNGFVWLNKNGSEILPADFDGFFTFVLEDSCPAGCNPFLPRCNSSDGDLPTCIKNYKLMDIEYGYSCSKYPATLSDLSQECEKFDSLKIRLNGAPVSIGLSATTSESSWPLCSEFDYFLTIASCKPGQVHQRQLEVELPKGIKYVDNDRGFTNSSTDPQKILFVIPDSVRLGTDLGTGPLTVTLRPKAGCVINGDTLISWMSASTYCGTPIVSDTFLYKLNFQEPSYSAIASTYSLDSISNISSSLAGNILSVSYNLKGAGNKPSTVFDNSLLVTVFNGSTIIKKDSVLQSKGTPNGIYTFSLTLPAACTTYSVSIVPRYGYVPSCGYDTLGNVIPSCKHQSAGNAIANFITITTTCITANFDASDSTICAGTAITFHDLTSQGRPVSWNWVFTNSGTTLTSSNQNPEVTFALAGTYDVSLTVTDSADRINSYSKAAYIIVNPLPLVNAGNNASICAGASVTIGTTAQSGVTYSWTSIPAGFISNEIFPSVAPLVTTKYIVTATNSSGCTSRDTVVVSIIPVPLVAISPQGNPNICPGGSVTLNANVVAGINPGLIYQWTNSGTVIAGAVGASYTANVSGEYTARVHTLAGCVVPVADSIKVTVNVQTFSAGRDTAICAGNPVTLGAQVQAVSYHWTSIPSGFTSSLVNPVVRPVTNTSYVLTALYGSGCTSRDTVLVTVNPLPAMPVITGQDTVCQGITAILSTTPVSGLSYKWSLNGQAINGATSTAYSALLAGNYTVTAKTFAGCFATSSIKTLTVLPLPVASFSTDRLLYCTAPAQVSITNNNVSAVNNYSWSSPGATVTSHSGANFPTLTYLNKGTFVITLTVTSPKSCVSIARDTITVGSTDPCCHDYTATLGQRGAVTTIDASLPPYNGTVNFNGKYHIKGAIKLTNGNFIINDNSTFYMNPKWTNATTLYCGGSIPNSANYIIVDNATLTINKASIVAECDSMWMGIFVQNKSMISTNGATISDAMTGIVIASNGFCSLGSIGSSSNSNFSINNSTFSNNGAVLSGSSTNTSSATGITNSEFYTDSLKMKTWDKKKAVGDGVFLFDTDFNSAKFRNNYFHELLRGLEVFSTNNITIDSNRFENIFEEAIATSGTTGANDPNWFNKTTTIKENKIVISNDKGPNFSFYNGKPIVVGIRWGLGIASITNNTISTTGTKGKRATWGIYFQVGVPTVTSTANTLSDLDEGFRMTDNYSSTYDISNNSISNTRFGINVTANPYNSSHHSYRCNTFQNTGKMTGRAIYVEPGAFLNNLGGDGTAATNFKIPNANVFKGINKDSSMVYDGTAYTSFRYYRFKNPLEDIHVTSTSNQPPVLANGIITVTAPLLSNCPGPNGIFRKAASNPLNLRDSINAMMDSLRFQLGSFRKMKEWQYEILTYHQDNNKLDSLNIYADSIKGCNLEAYNTFKLHLMNRFDMDGHCSKAHQCMDSVVSANPNDIEIAARTKYFSYSCRQRHDTTGGHGMTLPFMPMNIQDSTDLADVAASGTSLSEMACMDLQRHRQQTICNTQYTYVPVYPDCGPECKKKKEQFLIKGWEKLTGFKADKTGAQLSQNIPNPAENETIIPYLIPGDNAKIESAYITIQSVVNGTEVRRIYLTETGYSSVIVDLNGLPSGLYTYILVVNGVQQDVKKMVVIK